MINSSPIAFGTGSRRKSGADAFAGLLQDFYQDLLDMGVPDHLASLVRRIDEDGDRRSGDRKLAIIVESDGEARKLAAALLEETELRVVECASAEEALAVLQNEGRHVAFVFADRHLAGPRSGIEFVRSVATLWPTARIVITVEEDDDDLDAVPTEVVQIRKPWRGLDVLTEARRAVEAGPRRL